MCAAAISYLYITIFVRPILSQHNRTDFRLPRDFAMALATIFCLSSDRTEFSHIIEFLSFGNIRQMALAYVKEVVHDCMWVAGAG